MSSNAISLPSSRRDFLKGAGAAAALALAPSLPASDTKRKQRAFEVAAPLYAWDIHDEGVEQILDNLQQMAAVNSVYLIGIMHPERRPFREGDYPHNPVRTSYQVEDARCTWLPDVKRYGRVKPRLSEHDWLNRTDWLRKLVEAARKRGLKTGMELSHVLIDRERMSGEFADLAQRDLHGEVTPEGMIKWLRPSCPNHPDTIAYAVGLVSDVVANHGVDFVQSCIMSFDPAPPERGGGCFCEHCKRTAREFGLDLGKIQTALLADPKSEPAVREWKEFRNRTTARFYGRLHDAIHTLKADVDLRYNAPSRSYGQYGISLPLLQPHVDSMRLTYYAEQEGDPALMPEKRKWLVDVRRQLGKDFPLIAALGVRLKATAALIHEGVAIAVESGMNGITAGHYDCATFAMLREVRAGLITANVL